MSQRPDGVDDDILDRAIRDVPLPVGLEARAAPEALFSDQVMDRILTAVAIPHGLAGRLRDGVRGRADGAAVVDLERTAAAVGASSVAPRGVTPGAIGRRTLSRRRLPVRWLFVGARDAAVVATLLSCVAGLFFAGMEVSEWLARPGASRPRQAVMASRAARPTADDTRDGEPNPVDDASVARTTHGEPARVDADRNVSPTAVPSLGEPDVAVPAPAVLGAAGPATAGSEGFLRHLPLVSEPRRRVPRDAGFDIAFEIQHGESPFVLLSEGASLAVDQPPLAVRSDSFDALRAAIRSGRRQPAGPVRAEHLLAALPAPQPAVDAGAREPVLSVHAVRSLRERPHSVLVEVAVTAPLPTERHAPPRVATIILDRSAGAASPAAWIGMCRGLAAIAAQLRPIDRLSVIVAGAEAAVVADHADAHEIGRLARMLERDAWRGPVDLDAAMRQAVAPGRHGDDRVIVVSRRDSLERARDEARAAFVAWQRAAASGARDATEDDGGGMAFVLVDPAVGSGAGAGPGELGHVPADSVGIRRGMLDAMRGHSMLTLRQGMLRVEFSPAYVSAYRVVGHRHSAVESVTDAPVVPIDLHAGETARVVYEVIRTRTQPAAAEGEWLLRARFDGRLAVDGGPVAREVALHPAAVESASPLPSPHACELILAVEFGELAAGSVHASPTRRNARAVAALVRAWQSRGDVTPFGSDIIACLERQRGGTRGASAPFDVR